MTTRLVGQYELGALLGSGGMGAVYEAVHPRLGKRVAIKFLHAQLAQDSSLVGRFLGEGRAAARIRHPHVVDITDVGSSEGVPYLVMELLEGETLAAKLAREGPLAPSVLIDLLLPVCSALEAAHANGVLHRDLKPENIFLSRVASGGVHPKVVDFGIAKIRDDKSWVVKSSKSEMMGTPRYMSPEQTRDASSVDARADQYSLGVIAYECLTGRPPYIGASLPEIISAVLAGGAPSPRTLVPTLPDEVERAVLRAMATRADDRFASVRELAAALLPFASGKGRSQWSSTFGLASIAPPHEADEVPAARAPAPRGPGRILVIEDDEALRDNIVEMLTLGGFVVAEAGTGERGLELAREGALDLVLSDVTLPGIDGHEVLRQLRAAPATANTPFVFLSGRSERTDIRTGMKLGADDYLTKPVGRVELLDAVRSRLARFTRSSAIAIDPAHAHTIHAAGALADKPKRSV